MVLDPEDRPVLLTDLSQVTLSFTGFQGSVTFPPGSKDEGQVGLCFKNVSVRTRKRFVKRKRKEERD